MANKAIDHGADWVVLLGDDIDIHTPYHYRETYRTFLDIQKKLQCPFAFGCPYWNDRTFPGFPTFPVVGRQHWSIFGSLIPPSRKNLFVNQDLDPYLQRLYLKFGAAPPMKATLTNKEGGDDLAVARYKRINAQGWRDWVLKDVEPIQKFIESQNGKPQRLTLLDVVVPTYRLDLDYLKSICSLPVPENFCTTFLVIVDNPAHLRLMTGEAKLDTAARALEKCLESFAQAMGRTINNIRVRCNVSNLGVSASRNRGIDESSAEYILFLDDDVTPAPDLLEQYSRSIDNLEPNEVGLVGMVKFPRSSKLPLKHSAVLMSYLTYMFEIAANPTYQHPAWGVTANILVRRTKVRFDTQYAKRGGGEDVDFCLRLLEATGGRLKVCPSAFVTHAFWSGSLFQLSQHFFNWAVGDSALFLRFPFHTY